MHLSRRHAALAAAAILLLVAPVFAADPTVQEFKKAWEESSAVEEAEARAKAQVKALEKLKSATSVDAAQALVAIAIDPKVHWKPHEVATDLLGKMQEKPVRDWVLRELASTSESETRVRCVLCSVVAGWGDDDAEKVLVPLLKDKHAVIVASAADALSRVKRLTVVDALIAALKDAKDARVQNDISFALRRLTKKDLSDPAEWASWWSAERDKLTFDPPAPAEGGASEPAPAEGAETGSAVPRTTSDGSGLYERVTSEHVCFVIDQSGSMRTTGDVLEEEKSSDPASTKTKPGASPDQNRKKSTVSRLDYVKRELVNVIDAQLSKRASFNVIAFATDVTPWKKSLVAATDATKAAAKTWVNALKPTSETNLYGALEAAFADPSVDTIYLLTDGFPDYGKFIATDAICGEVKKWNATRKVRIHCICYLVGDGAPFHVIENKSMSKSFMKRLAADTGGTFKCFE
jgi:hypothetical protein